MKDQERNSAVIEFERRLVHGVRRLTRPGDGVLVAVSGGADSVSLFTGLVRSVHRTDVRIAVAHIDHGLRPESVAESVKVGALCQQLGVDFHVRHLQLAPGPGIEARARNERYEALESIRRSLSAQHVATAHTASDQAETVLMRLIRGASLHGAAGIVPARSDRVIRPLLFASRAEVLAYVKAMALPVIVDPMNCDPQFLRVRIRAHALPALNHAAGFNAERALSRFAQHAAEDEAWIEAHAARAFDEVRRDGETLDIDAVGALVRPLARRVLKQFLKRAGIAPDSELIDDVLSAMDRSEQRALPNDLLLACAKGRVWIEKAPPRKERAKVQVPKRGDLE